MPWQDVRPMDHRILFIADYLRGGHDLSALCALHGISRKTGYKWINRYETDALEGLQDRSRRPRSSPQQVPYAVREAVIALRYRGGAVLGPKKIQSLLRQQFPGTPPPSKTTIYLILKAAALIKPRQRRHRVPVLPGTLTPAQAPNELWTADFKGQFVLGNRRWCYPLTVMDHHSRYLIGCRGQYNTAGIPTRRAFEEWFRVFGLPQRIRTDNGVPFATRTAGGLSRLAIWWIRLGIVPERIRPGRPQQNGRHERMHRTLKAIATHPAARNLGAQQRQFDRFQQLYNEQRPHEALAQQTPGACYRPSMRPYPEHLPELVYPDYYQLHVVRPSGVIQKFNRQFYVSHLLAGECIGMCQVSESVWDVYFGPLRLGGFDLAQRCATSQRDDYFTLKV